MVSIERKTAGWVVGIILILESLTDSVLLHDSVHVISYHWSFSPRIYHRPK